MLRRALSLLRRSPALAALAALAVFAMAGFAVAASSDSTINACVKKKSGALRVVSSSKDCKKSERAISFDKRGRRGRTGAMGPVGPIGPIGPTGPQGPVGPQGPAGKDAPKAAAPNQAVIGTATLHRTGDPDIVFDVLGLDFEASNPSTIGSAGGGAGAGKVKFEPFKIVKHIDSSSPKLAQMALTGTHGGTLTVDLKKPGAATPYRRYAANDVLISSTRQDAPDGGGHPLETVSFLAAGFAITSPSGAPAGTAPVGRLTLTDAGATLGPVPVYGSSFEITNSSTGSAGSGGGTGKATLHDITVRKSVDKASVPLLKTLGDGTHFDSAKLELFGASGRTDVVHTYALGQTFVTLFEDQATGETATTPVDETVALTATTVRETTGASTVCWDVVNNKECTAPTG